MATEQHGHAANKLNSIGDEHDIALGAGVCKGTYKGGQKNVGQYKEQFEQRRHPGRSLKLGQERNSGN